MVRVFIQARMGSRRFPGKVLAPFQGKAVIARLIDAAAAAVARERIAVATSATAADDPLACYVRELGVAVFRGPLENVVERFQGCLSAYPCDWFFRLSADSPLLDPALLQAALRYGDARDVDLVTNVFPRTFPKGQSVEMIRAATFARIDAPRLTPQQQEHATQVYYYHPEIFNIVNLESAEPKLAETSYAVDTLEDLIRLEHLCSQELFPPKVILREVKKVA